MLELSRKTIAIIVCVITFIFTVIASVETTLVFAGRRRNAFPLTNESETVEENDADHITEAYDLLVNNYYVDVDTLDLSEAAIRGMLSSLDDPYTLYYSAEQMQQTNETRSGEFVGVGVSVVCLGDGNIYVVRSFKDSPAYEAGIIKGDVIVAVDGKSVSAENAEELDKVVAMIKGEEGTHVTLGIKRGEEVFSAEVERKALISSKVEYSLLNDGIGYILLYDFFGSAVEEMEEAISFFEDSGAKGVIVDLRDNGGGRVDICVDIADMFLDDCTVFYTEDRTGEREYYTAEDGCTELPLAVLINENSASASEIFAAAMKDYNRGIIVGKNSFGKGIMQTTYMLRGTGAAVQLTTAEFFSPNGHSIHKIGISPDIETEANEITAEQYYLEDVNPEYDAQLKSAYDYLKNAASKQETNGQNQ